MALSNFLRLVKPGDLVTAGNNNKGLRQLNDQLRYLAGIIEAAEFGSTIYAHAQAVEAELQVGMPAWYNAATGRFERSIATADIDNSGAVTPAASAQVWGIVATKTTSTIAEILLFGIADIDISAAVDGTVYPGTYYLSGAAPGKLVRQRPPVSVPVLRALPDGKVFVSLQFVDLLDRHTHYRFALACSPAGTVSPPAFGERHTITDADANLPGWLPADHASFAGLAPAGAVFGYNLSADPRLRSVWPPVPVSNAYLEWDRGLDEEIGSTGVPLGSTGACILDRNGIWWMSDCYGDVPWPTLLDSETSDSYSDDPAAECPRHLRMAMTLWVTKATFATDQTAVLSLTSLTPDLLQVLCAGTDSVSSTGHLQLAVNLDFSVLADQFGGTALKSYDPTTRRFASGPVVEGLYAGSDNIVLSGSATQSRTIGGNTVTTHQGLVSVTVNPATSYELDVQLVRLDGVEEAYFTDPPIMYLGFRAGFARSYRAKVHVPVSLGIASPVIRFRIVLLGRASGTLPALSMTARRIPRPTSVTALPLAASEVSVGFSSAVTLSAANQIIEITSDPMTIVAGDTVFFTLSRGASDGYASEVGVVRQTGVVSSSA